MPVGESILNFAQNNSGLVSGVMGLIGAAQQRKFEQNEAQKQREWNEAMQDKANDFSLQMWNMTNEYNSPVAQRARLEEAGLNPLYYGLDGSSANGFESAQALGYDRASASSFDNPVTAAIESAMIPKKMEQLQAQIDNLNANTAKQGQETETEIKRRQQMEVQIQKDRQEIENLIKSGELTGRNIDLANKSLEWYDRLQQANVSYQESLSKLNDSTRNRINALLPGEKELQNMQIEDFFKSWEKIDSEIERISVDTGIAKEDLENYALNHSQSGVFGSGVSLPNLIRAAKDAKKTVDSTQGGFNQWR